MTVKEIIEDWLEANGYGGLVNQEIPCGCILGDIAPCCEENICECEAGYVHRCDDCSPANREECTVEDCPTLGGYCVSTEKGITHYVKPPREPWIVDTVLQDVVEFRDADGEQQSGVVKMINPNHHELKVLVKGCVKGWLLLAKMTPENFIRIVGSDGASDGNAPADFAAVGEQVRQERGQE